MGSPKSSVKSSPVLKYQHGHANPMEDLLVVEEPLEIRIVHGPPRIRQEKSISVTMRTPGHDFELSAGFLFTEGIIRRHEDILSVAYCRKTENTEAEGNIVRVELKPEVDLDLEKLQRNFYTASSCGICGKTSLDAIEAQGCKVMIPRPDEIAASTLLSIPSANQQGQVVFKYTGGLHAAALLDGTGRLLLMREDVGRHNAVDKVVGAMLASGTQGKILFLSGRSGFELIQKAAVAEIPMVASVGAPSSLAVEVADRFGITLIGFLREGRFNVYSHPLRVNMNH